ncbi:MAG: hypothetical protein OXQ90_20400, partial [Gammaproteobacteria bacterium]|nr:hypothetical protein [Gammaproteobacteria bacterium]
YEALPREMQRGASDRADKAFATYCARHLQPGDRVLVKGSNTVFWTNDFVATLVRELDRGSRGA